MTRVRLADWSIASRCEPMIRVGVVLPGDAMRELVVAVPDRPYAVRTDAAGGGAVGGVSLTATAVGERVKLGDASRSWGPAPVITLTPESDGGDATTTGGGVRVHGVISGRGFHWQKRVDLTFGGTIEMRSVGGRLLVVNEVPLEDYLVGVITGEMSGECPVEFLKSQCVVARGWALARTEPKHAGLSIDRCNDDCCQRYQGTTHWTPRAIEGVRATHGEVLLDTAGRLVDANYSKSCGGVIESPQHVWGVEKPGQRAAVDAPAGSAVQRFLPVTDANLDEYLSGEWLADTDVFCSPCVVPEGEIARYLGKVDEGGGLFRWTVEFGREQLEDLLRRKLFDEGHAGDAPPLGTVTDLRPLRRGVSGRIAELAIDYRDATGTARTVVVRSEYRIRAVLHEKFLYSSAFAVSIDRDEAGWPTRIRLRGAGWGHGAGLCQIGALGMALRGHDYRRILTHYFEPVRLEALY